MVTFATKSEMSVYFVVLQARSGKENGDAVNLACQEVAVHGEGFTLWHPRHETIINKFLELLYGRRPPVDAPVCRCASSAIPMAPMPSPQNAPPEYQLDCKSPSATVYLLMQSLLL